MSSSYDRNIDRLRSAERSNAQTAMSQRTNMASTMGTRGINEANKLSDQLSDFSTTLKDMRKKDIEKKLERGRLDAIKSSEINAKKLVELQTELSTLTKTDTRYHEIKAEMLRMSGPNVYPDADRIAHLSPWGQVGYAKEKLRMFNETFPDKLNHAMANSEKAITIQGMSFTPKELHDNNIHGLPFKEAAMHIVADDIKLAAGLDKFSPELLELGGVNDAIQKAKESNTAKYRQRYNIEASSNTRSQAELTWKTSQKTGDDIYHFLVKTSATMDGNNNQLGNGGAWEALDNLIIQEGINQNNSNYAFDILNKPMPPELAKKLGAKLGTTYAQQWPNKVASLKQSIQDGSTKKINNDLKNLESAGTAIQVEFIKKARQADLTTQEVNEYKRRFGQLGLSIPSSVTNYETLTMRDQREDKQSIEALIASQDGYISHEQLDQFHPQAAVEYREKATKLEKAAIEDFDSEAKIKAYLDRTWESMGLKGNEKTPEYIEAMSNAKADYAKKFNLYVSMGYTPAEASHFAFYADVVKDKETGELVPDSEGVLKHIERAEENNKYIEKGREVLPTLKQGNLRVAEINKGKREMLDNSDIIFEQVVGGSYGKKQLDTIIENINKYGHNKGVLKNKNAILYYKGLARGKNVTWLGLVDAQLKVAGHDGLWPDERPALINLSEGKDEKGVTIADPYKFRANMKDVIRAFEENGDQMSVLYGTRILQDSFPKSKTPMSVWDRIEELLYPDWILEDTDGLTNPTPIPRTSTGGTVPEYKPLPKWATLGGTVPEYKPLPDWATT